jgi:L-threonylcarbamoyladenylate synthase
VSSGALGDEHARRLRACLASGGVAVFPADTVYGLGCDPQCGPAVERLYRLKGRNPGRPAAVMFFALAPALAALPALGARERAAAGALLPGGVTLLLPNRELRFPLACGDDPRTLGLRVPLLAARLAALEALDAPMLQSSANLSGGPDARRLSDVPRGVLEGADLALDGGELRGVASTVLDLRGFERTGSWRVLREGAVGRSAIARALASPGPSARSC